jgi:hypothetical protein
MFCEASLGQAQKRGTLLANLAIYLGRIRRPQFLPQTQIRQAQGAMPCSGLNQREHQAMTMRRGEENHG